MNEDKKISAAKEALKYIKTNSIIGIGTGSTVKPFITLLNDLVETKHLKIACIPTSEESRKALHKNIEIVSEDLSVQIDLTIDGADQVSFDNYLIKGGGGALLREKFVAINSLINITIVDDSKVTKILNGPLLPVEIIPFGYKSTINRLQSIGFNGLIRIKGEKIYKTDNGNYIFDINLKSPILDPLSTHNLLKSISGVIETGLFLQTSDIIIIGKNKDSVDVWIKGENNGRKNS
jgi:ribose 5-phosphate isomerase A